MSEATIQLKKTFVDLLDKALLDKALIKYAKDFAYPEYLKHCLELGELPDSKYQIFEPLLETRLVRCPLCGDMRETFRKSPKCNHNQDEEGTPVKTYLMEDVHPTS